MSRKLNAAKHAEETRANDDLVLNWDKTGFQFVLAGNWTLEEQGTKRVEVTGLNDKRMLIATLASTVSGNFCQCQPSTQGKQQDVIHILHSSQKGSTFSIPLTTGLIKKRP